MAGQGQRLAQHGLDPLRHRGGLLALLHVLEQDRELVAAQPRHGVSRPHRRLEGRAELDEEPVAHAVAEAVVDELEAIHVQEDDGEHALVMAARHRALQAR